MHAFNLSIQQAEADGYLVHWGSVWSTERVPRQPELHNPVSGKKTKKQEQTNRKQGYDGRNQQTFGY